MPHNDGGVISLDTYPALTFQPDTLDRVTRLEARDGVLSVYLDVEPSEMQREGFEAALLDLWKPVRAQVRDTDLAVRLEQEIDRVNAYVRSWDVAPGRSVAIFSSLALDTFLPVALDVPVLTGARFWPRAYLLPLIAALDEHERYCVALVDKERARFLTVWMGRIEQRSAFADPLPGRPGGGDWATAPAPRGRGNIAEMGPGRVHSSQAAYVRHLEYHVHLHLQRVIDELWRLSRHRTFDRLIIGGPPEAVSALRPMLPRSLAARVVGEFGGEWYASDAELVDRVRGIEEQAERTHEAALVSDILERAPKGQLAVTGWDGTLAALGEGRVHRLVLIEGETASGYACPEGHFVAKRHTELCPLCDEPVWVIDDLAAQAARLAMATDAEVEFVRGEAAELLRSHGAAAILRY